MSEEQFLIKIRGKKNIFIYGAGMVGNLVLKRLIATGIETSRISFVVTDNSNVTEFLGYHVYNIDEIKKYDDCIIVVSALEGIREQMLNELKVRGYDNYLSIDEELYEVLEQGYVQDFLNRNSLINCNKDILFMASDNNSSSGAFLCLVDLNVELKKRGIKSLVVLPNYGNGEQLLIDNNIEYTYVLSKDWLVELNKDVENDICQQNQQAVQQLEALIEQYHIKLVHNNTTYTYVGAIAAMNKKIPFVWHIREFIREQGVWFRDEVEAYNLINKSESIIPVSEYVSSCYMGFNKEKLQLIYDGIDIEKYYNKHSILRDKVIRILMPGNISQLKGQEQLVKAAAILKMRGLNLKVTFIGNGDATYISELKDLVKKNRLEEEICFWGRSNELEKWYKQSDIVVVCSRSEAFGRVTVEGQLAGCLVIGARCGATVELIKDNVTGLLYELNDCEMLAEKIICACKKSDEMQKIVTRAQEMARTKYSKSNNAQNVVKLYRTLIDC